MQLADGWYRGSCGAWAGKNQYGIETKLLVQLEINYADGGSKTICSDQSWDWSNDGSIRFADNKDGEIVESFRTPMYMGKAKATEHLVVPSASNNVPVTEHECFHPVITTAPNGKKLLDFGQNIAGIVSFQVRANLGQRMLWRFGELLDTDGNLTLKNIQCSNRKITTPLQQIDYTCGEGENIYQMCAYPKLNGIHCSDHKELLTDILRDEWGFNGLVVTDWGAMNDRVEGFRAGCDLNMPGGSAYMEKDVLKAVQNGKLPESAIDACAERVLRLALRAAGTLRGSHSCDYDDHHALAKKAACEGAVLLKNENGLLPLKEDMKIAVIGHLAKEMRYQGAGSSHINATRLSQPLDSLTGAVYAEGVNTCGSTTETMLCEAAETAKAAEVSIVFVGLPDRYESEGFDRSDMNLPEGHNRLVKAVCEANPNTVVVLLSGAPVECPWADKVKAILYMGLPGQAGGEAIADLLYGRCNPCGKLGESWPVRYADCVSAPYYGKGKDALYLEGIYIGYRYYDKVNVAVRWPFGYGLSYTSFAYSDLILDGDTVKVTVANIGSFPGAEIVQLYVETPQDGLHRPLRLLRHFARVELQPSEAEIISFTLVDRDFALWQDGWKVPGGTYRICVGDLRVELKKQGEVLTVPTRQAESWYERCQGQPTQQELEIAMGKPYIPTSLEKGSFTMDNTVVEMKKHSLIMKIMFKAVEGTIARGFGGKKDYENPEFRMLMESSAGSPLRSMMISGGMNNNVLPGMLEMANGHFLRGILKIIRG